MALLLSLAANIQLRAPLYAARVRVEWNIHWSQNLLQTTLIPVQNPPVGLNVTDLPPRGYDYHIQLRTWAVNLNQSTLQPVPQGVIYDRPQLGPQQPERTVAASYNPNLIGQDVLPFNQYSWPVPIGPTPLLQTWIAQTPILLQVPYRQYDWPLPKSPPPVLQTWQSWYNLNLIGQDVLPTGKQVTDLPPRDIDRSIQLRTWILNLNLALNFTSPNPPFTQFDWPVPKGPQPLLQTWTNTYNLNLIGQDKLPFNQKDWPVPGQPYRTNELRTWIDRAKAYLQRPFNQFDWPVPKAPQQPAPSFTASFPLQLIGQDKLPFRQQDWPVPKGSEYPIQLRTTTSQFRAPPPVVAIPFIQKDWPVPRGTADGRDRTFTFTSQFIPVTPPQPVLPNVERPMVQDPWDRDDWGNFIPGHGFRGT